MPSAADIMDIAGPLISAGSSIAGSLAGNNAQSQAQGNASRILATNNAQSLNTILSLYDQSRNDLAPYRALGGPSLAKLYAKAGLSKYSSAIPDFSTGTGKTSIPGVTGSGGGNLGSYAGGGAPDPTGNVLASQSAQALGKRSAIGTLVGGAIAGPVGAAIGGLVAKLWNNHNPDKTWASNAIDEVGTEFWGPRRDGNGGVMGEIKAGRVSAIQGKQILDQLWNGWINAMHNAGVDQSIIDRSIKSQTEYWKTTPAIIDQAAAAAPKTAPTVTGNLVPVNNLGQAAAPPRNITT